MFWYNFFFKNQNLKNIFSEFFFENTLKRVF